MKIFQKRFYSLAIPLFSQEQHFLDNDSPISSLDSQTSDLNKELFEELNN